MVVQSLINELIAQFKATYRKGAITPQSLGELLENIVEAAKTTVFTVNVSESKTQFVNDEQFMHVWSAMQLNQQVSFCICINYASGSKNYYYPTCVKSNKFHFTLKPALVNCIYTKMQHSQSPAPIFGNYPINHQL